MKLLLILHGIYAVAIGIVMILLPSLFLASAEHLAISSMIMYGITSIMMGILSFTLLKMNKHQEILVAGVAIFAVYHLGVASEQLMSLFTGVIHAPLLFIHGAFAAAWGNWLLRRGKSQDKHGTKQSPQEDSDDSMFLRK